MSRGKYSPAPQAQGPFDRNAYGEIAPAHPGPELYDTRIHYGDYNASGYDSYGYSAWERDGTFAGHGRGIDLYGHTEDEYLCDFDDDGFLDVPHTATPVTVVTDRGLIGSLATVA